MQNLYTYGQILAIPALVLILILSLVPVTSMALVIGIVAVVFGVVVASRRRISKIKFPSWIGR